MKPKLRTQRDGVEILVRTYQRYESIFSARLIKALRELERVQQQRRSEAVLVGDALIDAGEERGWSMPPVMIQEGHEECGRTHDNEREADSRGISELHGRSN